MRYAAWTLQDLAARLAAEGGRERRYKLVLEFVRGYLEEPSDRRAALIAVRPDLTGEPAWDAVVAGLADHYAAQDDLPQPMWTSEPERCCFPPFSPVASEGVRIMAMAHGPAGFLRHGVLLLPEDLEPV